MRELIDLQITKAISKHLPVKFVIGFLKSKIGELTLYKIALFLFLFGFFTSTSSANIFLEGTVWHCTEHDLFLFPLVDIWSSNNYYIFEKDLQSAKSIWIQVNGTSACASVTVNIYEGTDVVVSEYDSATDTSGAGYYDDLAIVIIDYDFTSTTK